MGTVANSTSTMHKIMSQPITLQSFEVDDMPSDLTYHVGAEEFSCSEQRKNIINYCENLRQEYCSITERINVNDDIELKKELEEQRELIWKELIRWVPESWLQTRTVTMNYENLLAICSKSQRRFHKLNEWSGKNNSELPNFINFARHLPYANDFIFIDEGKETTPV